MKRPKDGAADVLTNGLSRVREAVDRLASTKADKKDVHELRRRIA